MANENNDKQDLHRIVIVGGGAGGIELATALGDKLGRKKKAEIILVDADTAHIWKPLLHEVAAGTLDTHEYEFEYLALARWHHFRFRLGRVDTLNRERKEISMAPVLDDSGAEIIPRRTIRYDTLVIAVGSVANDFGLEGVYKHCVMLDTAPQAEEFRMQLKHTLWRLQTHPDLQSRLPVNVVIVGTGATGVELTAELHSAMTQEIEYGLDGIDLAKAVRFTLVGATPRVLPALPEYISQSVEHHLSSIGIVLRNGERVIKVTETGVETKDGEFIPGDFVVWAAGIKAPDFLKDFGGLEANSNNQLVVSTTLQTTRDPDIFAFGDCAECTLPDGTKVPPRAQAAAQQAKLLVKSLTHRLSNKPLGHYNYRDLGTLVSLGRLTHVGNLMSGAASRGVALEGKLAQLMYWSLMKRHQLSCTGWLRTLLATAGEFISKPARPPIKLH